MSPGRPGRTIGAMESDPQPTPTDTNHALPPPSPPPWRLVRARRAPLAGVCAGLSVAAGVDAALVRLAFIVVGLSGWGILLYILMASFVAREDPARGRLLIPAPPDTARWLRLALVVVPVLSVTGVAGGGWWHGLFFFGPGAHAWHLWRGSMLGLLLLLGGVGFIWLRRQHEYRPAFSGPTAGTPGPTGATTAGGPVLTDTTTRLTESGTFPPPAWWEARPPTPPSQPTQPIMAVGPSAPARSGTPATLVAARVIAWLVLLGGIATGALAFGLERIGALSIALPVLAALLSLAATVVVVIAATRAHTALVVLASLLALAVPTLTIAGLAYWKGGLGDRLVAPTSVTEIAGQYRLAIGRLTLDLSRVPMSGQTLSIQADTRIGQLEVLVPDTVAVNLNAHVAAGDIQMFGRDRGGVGLHEHLTDAPAGATGQLNLDLKMATGQIRVCRASAAGSDCGRANTSLSFSS